MLKHNFLLAVRNFKRFKSTFFINLVALSTGLACVILIFLWLGDEIKIDTFHANNTRLYRVMANHHQPEKIVTIEGTLGLLAEAFVNEAPEIEFVKSNLRLGILPQRE